MLHCTIANLAEIFSPFVPDFIAEFGIMADNQYAVEWIGEEFS